MSLEKGEQPTDTAVPHSRGPVTSHCRPLQGSGALSQHLKGSTELQPALSQNSYGEGTATHTYKSQAQDATVTYRPMPGGGLSCV